MKYKIEVHGRGDECYIHLLDEEQKETLSDKGVEEDQMDSDDVSSVLNKPDIFTESDDIILGVYNEDFCLWLKVFNENGDLIWESGDENKLPYEYEYRYVDDKSLLVCDYVKGHFFSYNFEIDEEFNPEKLSMIITEIGERLELITGFYYNDVDLNTFREFDGDYWSKGLTYYLN